jgi:hypothetical protein
MNSVYTVAVTTPSAEEIPMRPSQSHAFADVGLLMLSFRIIASQKLRYQGMSVAAEFAGYAYQTLPSAMCL